jgi:hypothetical protein
MYETFRLQRYFVVGDTALTNWDVSLSRSLDLNDGPQSGRSLTRTPIKCPLLRSGGTRST